MQILLITYTIVFSFSNVRTCRCAHSGAVCFQSGLEQQIRLQSPVSSGVVRVMYPPRVGLYRQELRQTNKPTNKQTHKKQTSSGSRLIWDGRELFAVELDLFHGEPPLGLPTASFDWLLRQVHSSWTPLTLHLREMQDCRLRNKLLVHWLSGAKVSFNPLEEYLVSIALFFFVPFFKKYNFGVFSFHYSLFIFTELLMTFL